MSRIPCPWCGKTMVPGELDSQRAITWYPSEVNASLKDFLSWEGFKELCAPITGNIQVPKQGRWETARTQIPIHHCPDCQVFLFRGKVK